MSAIHFNIPVDLTLVRHARTIFFLLLKTSSYLLTIYMTGRSASVPFFFLVIKSGTLAVAVGARIFTSINLFEVCLCQYIIHTLSLSALLLIYCCHYEPHLEWVKLRDELECSNIQSLAWSISRGELSQCTDWGSVRSSLRTEAHVSWVTAVHRVRGEMWVISQGTYFAKLIQGDSREAHFPFFSPCIFNALSFQLQKRKIRKWLQIPFVKPERFGFLCEVN